MHSRYLAILLAFVIAFAFNSESTSQTTDEPATGPLRLCKENPRYFTDDSGQAIFLTGSHHWYNLVDMGPTDPPPKLDYTAYLDWMSELNHNFMRMWAWELVTWKISGNAADIRNKNTLYYISPFLWQRTGPGKALDGKPKFNLDKFNPAYFERMRSRVIEARDRGIYVSVMLFEGYGLQRIKDSLKSHPFHKENNINGINGDKNGDGLGVEIHELVNPDILAIQKKYIKKVIDTVNDLDNVLYEISNENHPESTPFQYAMIDFIHDYEKSKAKQHPVGMTFQFKGGSNQDLYNSPADWISPNPDGGYRDNPPANKGGKVIITDTDHLWGIGGNQAWLWKSVCRGLNPIFMDRYDGTIIGKKFDPRWESIRKSMGYARRMANRMNFTTMIPHGDLVSTKYCLAEPGVKYLIYLPKGQQVEIDLSNAKGRYTSFWFNPNNRERQRGKEINGGAKQTLTSPFGEVDAVLLIQKSQ